jgi:small subunit ribosomal protein S11
LSKQIRKNVKKTRKKIYRGVVYIQTTQNNTIVTITNIKGDAVCWSSAGSCDLKGRRKATAYAAKLAAANAAKKARREFVLKEAKVLITGPGAARDTAIHEIHKAGIKLTILREKSGVPHNGCRPPKRRRV